MLAALIQQRVPSRGLLLAPVIAVPAAVGGIFLGQILASILPVTRATAVWTPAIASLGSLVFVGYVAGLLLTRQQRRAIDAHKRGTVLTPAQRRGTAAPRAA